MPVEKKFSGTQQDTCLPRTAIAPIPGRKQANTRLGARTDGAISLVRLATAAYIVLFPKPRRPHNEGDENSKTFKAPDAPPCDLLESAFWYRPKVQL